MKSVLITGANKGIGLATAKELVQNGYFVYIGSRDIQKGEQAVKSLIAEGFLNVKAIELDVVNQGTILAAKNSIEQEQGQLDVLINNAAISGVRADKNGNYIPGTVTAEAATGDTFREVYETNVYGVVRVTQVFLDLLKKSAEPRIVMVSSTVGSLSLQSDANWPAYHSGKYAVYGSSKSALNMYSVHLAYELRDTAFKINMVDPGYTSTDFTYHQGGDVSIAGKRIAKYAMIDKDGPTGKFFSEESNPETGIIGW